MWVKAGSAASTSVRVTITDTGRAAPRAASARSSAFMMSTPMVPWVCAPHQSSGTGGTTCAASWFLIRRLPTWGPLPCVRATRAPAATRSATRSMARPTAAACASGVALPSGAVMALPPSAIRTRPVPGGPPSSLLTSRPYPRGGPGSLAKSAQPAPGFRHLAPRRAPPGPSRVVGGGHGRRRAGGAAGRVVPSGPPGPPRSQARPRSRSTASSMTSSRLQNANRTKWAPASALS